MSLPTLRRNRRTPLLAAATLALCLIAAACGDSDSAQTGGSPDAANTPEAPASTQSSRESAPEPDATDTAPDPTSDASSMGASPGLPAPEDSASSEDVAVPAPEPTPEPTPLPESDLPSVDVLDVATGDTVNLASYAPSDGPIVLWFWAPH